MAHTMWIQNVSIEHNYEQYLQWERGIFFGLKDAHILQMQGMILFTLQIKLNGAANLVMHGTNTRSVQLQELLSVLRAVRKKTRKTTNNLTAPARRWMVLTSLPSLGVKWFWPNFSGNHIHSKCLQTRVSRPRLLILPASVTACCVEKYSKKQSKRIILDDRRMDTKITSCSQ